MLKHVPNSFNITYNVHLETIWLKYKSASIICPLLRSVLCCSYLYIRHHHHHHNATTRIATQIDPRAISDISVSKARGRMCTYDILPKRAQSAHVLWQQLPAVVVVVKSQE